MKYLVQYMRDRMAIVGLVVVFLVVFGSLTALYGLPLNGVVYGGCLAIICTVLFGIIDYWRYHKQCVQLAHLKEMAWDLEKMLPIPRDFVQESYQEALLHIGQEKRALSNQQIKRWQELHDFYTLWVHQIKTPIAAMDLILQDYTNATPTELRQELFKIERYVELVLGYLRLEDMASDLVVGEYLLEDMIKQAVKKYAPTFIAKKIAIQIENVDKRVRTDEKWLVFVLEQLVSNALKYSEKGQIRLFCEGNTKLVLKDEGIGISPEDLPRVFEKGFTGFNGRMDKKATGLGLYLCKKTLAQLGHTIVITSQLGVGTRVEIGFKQVETIYE